MITLPVLVADQPENVYPLRVGAVGADEMLPPIGAVPASTELPL